MKKLISIFIIIFLQIGFFYTAIAHPGPWTPTGVELHNGDIYVLEYTNANGPASEGWFPRVRKIGKDGKVSTIVNLSSNK